MKSNGVTGGLLAPEKNPFYVQRGELKQDQNWQAASGVAGTQIPSLVGNNKCTLKFGTYSFSRLNIVPLADKVAYPASTSS